LHKNTFQNGDRNARVSREKRYRGVHSDARAARIDVARIDAAMRSKV